MTRFLPSEQETLALGAAFARAIEPGLVVYLKGELGAGKTTFARGVLRGLGHTGRVKSPTFTLVEVYKFSKLYLYHFDFYRFENPREFEEAGFGELFGPAAVCLVEWPEKASGLPEADIEITMSVTGSGRTAEIRANTEVGRLCLERFNP